jgi:thiamine biosynthesis protein ThiS
MQFMKLVINGKSRDVEATNVENLLVAMELAGQAVAVEVNESVVRKRDHGQTLLAEGDRIELVTLVGGG